MPDKTSGKKSRLSPEDGAPLVLKTYQGRRVPLLVLAVVVLAFELFMMVSVLVKPGPVNSSPSRLTFFLLYVVLFVLTLVCLVVLVAGRRWFDRNPAAFLNICVVYAFCICLWSAFLSAYSHRNSVDISVYLYVCLCVAIVVPMRPWHVGVLFGGTWLLFMVMLTHYLGPGLDAFSSRLNSAFASLLAVVIAIMMRRARINDYLNEKTILAQNAQIKQMNEQLNAMVTVDALTQIYNRRFLDREFPRLLQDAREKGQPVALVMLDIDWFKQYNDRYGHQAGDVCLHRVTRAVQTQLPKENTYFVRYGGEEFLVLLVGMEPEDVRELAEQLRAGVQAAAMPNEDAPCGAVTISVGVCCSRRDGKATMGQLIHYADTAMYDAKSAGRNCVSAFRFTGTEAEAEEGAGA